MQRNRPRPRAITSRARRLLAGSSLLAAGAAAGGLWAASTTAGASTTSTASSTSAAGSSTPAAPSGQPRAGAHPYGLNQSGTVSAVGASAVTITSSSGQATTYAVTATSDIDKNGEAKLSNLTVGDKVTFDYTTSGTTKTIGHLHAGSEALDRPTGAPPNGGPMGGPGGGGAPSGYGPSSGSSSTAA